jgi:hypothetical protein
MPEKKDLFDFMLKRIRETGAATRLKDPQAFIRWFINLYFLHPHDIFISDGKHDGTVDAFFTTDNGAEITHHIVNSKFTAEYNKLAPRTFYDEILFFNNAFEHRNIRDEFLERAVKAELRPKYRALFEHYDNGQARLMFITNLRRNNDFYPSVKNIKGLEIFHLEELIQYLIDDIDGAMPKTQTLLLSGIHTVLTADQADTEVPTSIVFARVSDFITYMRNDPYDLLFARNVRVAFSTSESPVNKAILETFKTHPTEFAYSNNGITIICDEQDHDAFTK